MRHFFIAMLCYLAGWGAELRLVVADSNLSRSCWQEHQAQIKSLFDQLSIRNPSTLFTPITMQPALKAELLHIAIIEEELLSSDDPEWMQRIEATRDLPTGIIRIALCEGVSMLLSKSSWESLTNAKKSQLERLAKGE
ncbi:MAG: hypothetical protein K6347_03180 [Campylobacterales bacterium]